MAYIKKENAKLSLCFNLYILYFYSIVCIAQEKRSDTLFYDNLPIIYNVAEDCQPHHSQKYSLNTCPSLAWLVTEKIRLRLHIHNLPNTDIEDCFQKCLNTPECVAVTNSYSHNCFTYGKYHTRGFDSTFTSFILTCCQLKPKLQSNFQNLPIVFANSFSQTCKTSTLSCTNVAFVIWEKKIVVSKRNFKNKNVLECMNECLKDKQCRAFSFYVHYMFITECDLSLASNNNGQAAAEKYETHSYANVYEMSCCQQNYQQMLTTSNNNLMLLHQPSKVCKSDLTKINRNCAKKFWYVQENVRMKGPFRIHPLQQLENCLKDCLENMECFSVSVDWTYSRCLFFYQDRTQEIFTQQLSWTSYFIKCCD